jgi:hypothetical protein
MAIGIGIDVYGTVVDQRSAAVRSISHCILVSIQNGRPRGEKRPAAVYYSRIVGI